MDNPTPESATPLDANQASEVFAAMLDPQEPEPVANDDPDAAAIEALQADSGESDPDSDAQTEQPETFTVKIDGKDVPVTLDELRNGYQRQQDYTRKTMEISEARKAAESEIHQARQERQAYAQQLQAYQQQLGQALGETQNINWQQLLETDPTEYLKQRHLFEQRQAAFQHVQQEQAVIWQQQQAEQAQNVKRFVAEQQEQLLAKLPDWKDETKAKAAKAELQSFLKANAFTDDEIGSVIDHRQVILAHKAMQYDRLMAKAQAASKRVQTLPPKVERPGVSEKTTMDRRSSAFQKLSRSGSVEDAAAVFASIL